MALQVSNSAIGNAVESRRRLARSRQAVGLEGVETNFMRRTTPTTAKRISPERPMSPGQEALTSKTPLRDAQQAQGQVDQRKMQALIRAFIAQQRSQMQEAEAAAQEPAPAPRQPAPQQRPAAPQNPNIARRPAPQPGFAGDVQMQPPAPAPQQQPDPNQVAQFLAQRLGRWPTQTELALYLARGPRG